MDNLLIAAVAWKQTAASTARFITRATTWRACRWSWAGEAQARRPPAAVVSDVDDTILLPLAYWGHLINRNMDFFDDPIWDGGFPRTR